jgi:hypothetical protein
MLLHWRRRQALSGPFRQWFLLVLTSKATDAIQVLTSTFVESRESRTAFLRPLRLSYLALAYSDVGHFDDARRCIDEAQTAIESSGERWFEANIDRVAGEIALKLPIPNASKAERHFERALAVARKQQAKSLELGSVQSFSHIWFGLRSNRAAGSGAHQERIARRDGS